MHKFDVFFTVFIDYYHIVLYEFLPQGAMVSAKYYLGILHHLCEAIYGKLLHLQKNNLQKLYYDNAPAHKSSLL